MASFKMAKMAKSIRDDGRYIFSDFSNGLYMLETPRGIGEQLASLALVGGRNVWAEKSALVSQYGYTVTGKIPEGERVIAVSDDGDNASSFFIVTYKSTVLSSGETKIVISVYLHTAFQGLKKYKTTIPEFEGEPLICRRGSDLILSVDKASYMLGSWYNNAKYVEIKSGVPVNDMGDYYDFTLTQDDAQYFWNGKQISINNTFEGIVQSVIEDKDTGNILIRVTSTTHPSLTGTASLGEKTLIPITLHYEPEDTSTGLDKDIVPTLMAICVNRLFVVDITGDIYYSQVGTIDSFKEKSGAGFFGGFYNDTSKVLSLEDFMGGCLITKETGIYHMTIGDSVEVKKITQVGQQYASDHVIVGDEVYCYDSNTGQIVKAAGVNVFGSMVAGGVIIPSEYLGSRMLGIDNSKRFLTYNAENSILILYYGEQLNKGVLLTISGNMFPRELNLPMSHYLGFNQGVAGVSTDGTIIQDFKRGTIIPELSSIAEFEQIGLRDNRLICSSILEVTELNDVTFNVSTINAGYSTQSITPSDSLTIDRDYLPPMLYSDYEQNIINNTYSTKAKWVEKRSGVTRIYAPMSGRNGVSITLEFKPNENFCLAALRLPDFSQGE